MRHLVTLLFALISRPRRKPLDPSALPWWGWTWRHLAMPVVQPSGKLLGTRPVLVLVSPSGRHAWAITDRESLRATGGSLVN